MYKWGHIIQALTNIFTFLLLCCFSKTDTSWFYNPFQAARHEHLLLIILILFALFYLAAFFNKIHPKLGYGIGIAHSFFSLGFLLFRCYLVRQVELSALISIVLMLVALICMIIGWYHHRNDSHSKIYTKILGVLICSYLIFAYGFYPLTYFISWVNRADITLKSLSAAKDFKRFSFNLNDSTTYHAYYGEMHGHTYFSIDARIWGACHPDEYYQYARDVAGLDFCSLTEHDSPNGIADNPEQWRYVVKLTEDNNDPGNFVTFNAFEWTSGEGHNELKRHWRKKDKWAFLNDNSVWGHRNIFFSGSEVPEIPFSHADPESDTPEEVWKKMDNYNTLAVPHHPLGGPVPPFKWDHYHEKYEPLVEIYSYHGNSEAVDAPHRIYNAYFDEDGHSNHSVQHGLNQHYHFGLIGSTDTHAGWGGNGSTHPENSKPEKLMNWLFKVYNGNPAMGGGLAGVFATELTREGIWDALKKKRTFATTGPRMVVVIKANDKFMGEVLRSDDETVNIHFEVQGTSRLKLIEVIKNGKIIYSTDNTDSTFLSTTIQDSITTPYSYYYLRVTQQDNEMAWSSPIWVEK